MFEQKLLRLSKQLDQIERLIADLNRSQLTYKTSDEEWSILRIIEHLVLAERNTNIYVRKKILAGNNLVDAGVKTWFEFLLVKVVMFLGIKFKAPRVVDPDDAQQGISEIFAGDQLIENWKKERVGIIDFLADIDEPLANKLIFKHGIGIRLNLYQMLDWMYIHIDRHKKQINRIINNEHFPTN